MLSSWKEARLRGFALVVVGLISVGVGAVSHAFDGGTMTFDGSVITLTRGGIEQIETIRTGQGGDCAIDNTVPAGEVDLWMFDSADGTPGYGKQKSTETVGLVAGGRNCGLTSIGETIAGTFGGYLPPPDGDGNGGTKVISAVLEFLVKGNAVAAITVYDLAGQPLLPDPDDDGPLGPLAYSYLLTTGLSACEDGVAIDPGVNEALRNICGSDSNPDNADDVSLPLPFDPDELASPDGAHIDAGDWSRIEIEVLEGVVGIAGFTLVLETEPTGELDCDEVTPPQPFSLAVEVPGAESASIQCKRIDDGGGACQAVDYLLTAACSINPSTGQTECQADFLHDLQQNGAIERSEFRFICEAIWPGTIGNFAGPGPVVPLTEQYWTPALIRGPDLNWCPGVEPVFSLGCEPTLQLSDTEVLVDPDVSDGGNADWGSCSASMLGSGALGSYVDVIVDPALNPDQCVDAACPGRQLGCLLDERQIQIDPDPAVVPDPATDAVETWIQSMQRWLVEGDYRSGRRL